MSKKDKGGGKARIEALEGRLGRLEAMIARTPATAEVPDAESGAAREGGRRLRLDLRCDAQSWRLDSPVADLLAADWPACAGRLAALGHPVRLAILRRALDGEAPATVLQQAAGATTTGQFYHHLRELTAAGWLVAQRRGVYAVPPGRFGPILVAVSLARID